MRPITQSRLTIRSVARPTHFVQSLRYLLLAGPPGLMPPGLNPMGNAMPPGQPMFQQQPPQQQGERSYALSSRDYTMQRKVGPGWLQRALVTSLSGASAHCAYLLAPFRDGRQTLKVSFSSHSQASSSSRSWSRTVRLDSSSANRQVNLSLHVHCPSRSRMPDNMLHAPAVAGRHHQNASAGVWCVHPDAARHRSHPGKHGARSVHHWHARPN